MKIFLPLAFGALALSGCQSTNAPSDYNQDLAAEIAARQGEEVNEICFIQNINGWRELGRKSVLLQRGVNDWFQIELNGTCDPQFAFEAIGIQSRPAASSCLSRGDKIDTFDSPVSGACYISKIYKWNEKASVSTAE